MSHRGLSKLKLVQNGISMTKLTIIKGSKKNAKAKIQNPDVELNPESVYQSKIS